MPELALDNLKMRINRHPVFDFIGRVLRSCFDLFEMFFEVK